MKPESKKDSKKDCSKYSFVKKLFDSFPCHKRENMRLVDYGVGWVLVEVIVSKEQLNLYETLDGGYHAVFIDSPIWLAAMTLPSTRNRVLWTTSIHKIEFLNPVREGEKVLIHSEVTSREGHVYYGRAKVMNGKGKVVAEGETTNKDVTDILQKKSQQN